jgi:cobyrinic acid a,c-diamide synthase
LANGLIIAAPRSGSGKTLITLGLLAALRRRGLAVAPAKTGPDYIDAAIHARVAGTPAVNLDPWAMRPQRLRSLAAAHGAGANLLLIEGVMGLFDGAMDGTGSTADLAAVLRLPVVLVADADRQAQSIAPLIAGFARWRADVHVAGVIVNRAATTKHEAMLRAAIAQTGLPVLGVLPRRAELHLPERHLGLVLPDEIAGFDAVVQKAGEAVGEYVDLNHLLALSQPLSHADPLPPLPPLGQRIAIARDDAFAFTYPHWLTGWRAAGAELTFFSPLLDQAPDPAADAVFLPGGYPELHGPALSNAQTFATGLHAAQARGALIYGECGGFMVLGQTLTDRTGTTYPMTGLLPHATRIDRPKRTLGYRRLGHHSALPWPSALLGHEFHYSSAHGSPDQTPLFTASDASGAALAAMGIAQSNVLGSYAHVIDLA